MRRERPLPRRERPVLLGAYSSPPVVSAGADSVRAGPAPSPAGRGPPNEGRGPPPPRPRNAGRRFLNFLAYSRLRLAFSALRLVFLAILPPETITAVDRLGAARLEGHLGRN